MNTIEDLISNYAHGDKEGLNMPLEDLLDSNKWKQAFRANVQIKRSVCDDPLLSTFRQTLILK